MAYQDIKVERDGAVGIVTLDRPKVLNALGPQLLTELVDALEDFDRDPEVRCIALLGSDRAFAAGADISEMAEASPIQMLREDTFSRIERIRSLTTPVVAGVSGFALGGGCELAMACDLIVASETAQFGQPEINLGIIPGAGGTQRLPRAVGKAVAMDMVLTGRTLSADEARCAGLVARVVAAEAWRDETLAVCRTIASKSPLALQMAREAVNAAFETTLRSGIEQERRAFHVLFASEDQAEGMHAFLEKRSPAFTGA
ncbi:MAG: enoyl-CoA hydratase/isomerase family protein [Thermoleophilia bacterium]|nr:enoyl-CoA hydratase/isomerase family protein [Thermoleophilia bacterium]